MCGSQRSASGALLYLAPYFLRQALLLNLEHTIQARQAGERTLRIWTALPAPCAGVGIAGMHYHAQLSSGCWESVVYSSKHFPCLVISLGPEETCLNGLPILEAGLPSPERCDWDHHLSLAT